MLVCLTAPGPGALVTVPEAVHIHRECGMGLGCSAVTEKWQR